MLKVKSASGMGAEVQRQTALKRQRENAAAPRAAEAFRVNNPTELGALSEEFYALTHANLVLNYELAGEPEADQEVAPVYRAYMAKPRIGPRSA
jgi:hypothetical protein